MDRGNAFAGTEFRAAVLSLLVFSVALAGIGGAVTTTATRTMMSDFRSHIAEEVTLYSGLYRDDGLPALVLTANALARTDSLGHRLLSVFSPDGRVLAGNPTASPDGIGWRTVTAADRTGRRQDYQARAVPLDDLVLLVGRSLDPIASMRTTLALTLVGAGAAVIVMTMLIGYAWSRRTMRKLDRLADTLDRVSRGDTSSRLPVGSSNDQIDRISLRVNEHLDRLASLTQTMRSTIVAIAHELRTPLNRAYLLVQTACEPAADETARTAALAEAEREVEGLTVMFDAVLRIARIETSSDSDVLVPLSTSALAAEIYETYRTVLEAADQTLTFATDDGDVPMVADEKMIWQLVANLVENASLHGPAGTAVTLCVGAEAGGAVVTVTDDGPGIPAEKYEEVMKPFHRLNPRRDRGTGLGLALVRAIADRHHATVTLGDNAPGLVVTVRFPPVSQRPSGPTPAVPA